ncbi:MAG: hypothetical protein EU529_17050 [Promethearchaeota archaeon]|nr:MAG: hypothetical protein EU529_17050 [Candidatus Lokiarchaeota archaeon]
MSNKYEIDAKDLELEHYEEEKKPLSSRIDDISRSFRKKIERLPVISIHHINPNEWNVEHFYSIIPSSGTGEIKNLIFERFLFKDRLIELDVKLREYSEGIVGLPDNWDGHGSRAITIESWNTASALVREILYNLWYDGFDISIPLLLPDNDGNFQIYWETEEFKLLLTIPSSRKELVHIYGEKSGHPEYELEVRINYELVSGVIIEWIKKIL